MKNYLTKLRHILPSFVVIAAACIIAIVLSRYIMTVRYPLLHINKEIWEFWISFAVPAVAVLIWMRPRFRIMHFGNDNAYILMLAIPVLAIGASIYNAQNYLVTSTGRLQTIENIYRIDSVPRSAYYKIKEFATWKENTAVYTDFRTSGKNDEHFDMTIYFAVPIMSENETDTAFPPTHKYWYAVKYKETISNSLEAAAKESAYKKFYTESATDLNNKNLQTMDHFDRMDESSDRTFFLKGITQTTEQKTDGSYVILEASNELYENRTGNSLAWIFISLAIGLGVMLFALLWPDLHDAETASPADEDNEWLEVIRFLVPKGDHFITSIILDLNIIVFLVMTFSGVDVFSPNSMELLQWGGNERSLVLKGEWWRLFTSTFVHAGIMHLVLNGFGLVFAAIFIEPFLGRRNYLILYILSGLCASLSSIWWHPDTVSVGASGAIFGVYGAILGLALIHAFPKESRNTLLTMIGVYVGINLIWGLTGGIDNAAHIGGLLSGAVIGAILYKISGANKPMDENMI
jgi:rhomboid protease GluP